MIELGIGEGDVEVSMVEELSKFKKSFDVALGWEGDD